MIWRETARPIPEPSVLVVKNGVKIFSATSAGIAEPLLVISIWMRSSASILCDINSLITVAKKH